VQYQRRLLEVCCRLLRVAGWTPGLQSWLLKAPGRLLEEPGRLLDHQNPGEQQQPKGRCSLEEQGQPHVAVQ
jgi:hypothetical protein